MPWPTARRVSRITPVATAVLEHVRRITETRVKPAPATVDEVSTLFTDYAPVSGCFDEMVDGATATIRPGYAAVHSQLTTLSPPEIRARADFLARTYGCLLYTSRCV